MKTLNIIAILGLVLLNGCYSLHGEFETYVLPDPNPDKLTQRELVRDRTDCDLKVEQRIVISDYVLSPMRRNMMANCMQGYKKVKMTY
jgi:hypothetical protein